MSVAGRLQIGYRQRAIGAVVAAGAFVLLAGLLIAVAVSDVVAGRHDELSRARRAIQLSEQSSLRGVGPALSTFESRLLPGANAGEAQASLQTAIKDLALRHELAIESLQPMPPERAGGLFAVKLKLVATVSESRLGIMLKAMIENAPQLAFDALEIRPDFTRVSDAQPPEERRLAIRLDVTGFTRATQTARETRQ